MLLIEDWNELGEFDYFVDWMWVVNIEVDVI